MAVAWNDDPAGSEAQIAANIHAVAAQIYAGAPRREQPSLATAQDWHRGSAGIDVRPAHPDGHG
jgi:hypothetical protein